MYSKLPTVKDVCLDLDHFPNRFYAAVYRLWETAPKDRIAAALSVSIDEIECAARELGLPENVHNPDWRKRGYITTIRNAWHILPYDAILRLLDMGEDELAHILKEDDFLEWKLGGFKPSCPPVINAPLDREGRAKLERIRKTTNECFFDLFDGKAPFSFFGESSTASSSVESHGEIRLIYSYSGLYAGVLDNDISVSYPDELLKKYSEMGVNAIWLPVILYQVVPFPFDESYSLGYEQRRSRLRELISHAKRFGIKVYLYLNEPRCMPLGFFEKHSDMLGASTTYNGALCWTDARTKEYLNYAVTELCRSVEGIGGFFLITASENLTHCKSKIKEGTTKHCERCKDTPISVIISEVVNTVSRAAWSVAPELKIIVWTWAWDSYMNAEEIADCVRSLEKDVIIQCNSEAQKPYEIGGVKSTVRDYSISIPGPGELAKSVWSSAIECGHEVMAKVQINNSWECSTVPFLPVYDLIREHMRGLGESGVKHIMQSWTLGGYPSFSLRLASEMLKDASEENYIRLLKDEYGDKYEAVREASRIFSAAFSEFPFYIKTLYTAPQNPGPSNLLYLKPSGFVATMTCYSYDDVDSWRSIYPKEVYLEQMRKLSDGWARGLPLARELDGDSLFRISAESAYIIFRSAYLQTLFVFERERKNSRELLRIAREERELALSLYHLMSRCNLIGYEAANHYYFNKGMLMEKVISCEHIIEKMSAFGLDN